MTTSLTLSRAAIRPSSIAWSMWGIVTFFYTFQYILRVSPSVMLDHILQKFSLNAAHFGKFSSTYYLGYALMHIPFGLMLDRFSLRWVLSLSIFLSVLGFVPLAISDHWLICIIGRFFVGAASSGAILSVFKVCQLYFPQRWFSRLLGISVTIGLMGAIYGSTPVDQLNKQIGWENVVLMFFGIGGTIALLVALLCPHIISKNESSLNMWQNLFSVFRNKRVIGTALLGALMVGPLEGFADVWAVAYLETVCGFERTTATSLPSLIFIGMCVGSPLLPAVAEKFQVYRSSIMTSAIVMMLAFGILLYIRPSVLMTSVLFFLIGIFSAYQILVITMNSQSVDIQQSGLVTASTNMIIMLFGSVFHIVMTQVMNLFWDGKIVNNIPVYTPDAYVFGISVIPIALLMAFLGFWALKPQQHQ